MTEAAVERRDRGWRGFTCFVRNQDQEVLGQQPEDSTEDIAAEIGRLLRKLEGKELPPAGDQAAKAMGECLKELNAALVSSGAASSSAAASAPEAPSQEAQEKAAQAFASPGLAPAVPAVDPSPKAAAPPAVQLQKVVQAAVVQAAMTTAQRASVQPGALAPALNDLILALWPRIGAFVQDLIKDSIEPSINESLPGVVKAGGGVKFTRVNLGDSSPQLGPLTVEHNKENGYITMHMGVNVTIDLDIELLALKIPIGVNKFVLKGTLLILMAPPMNKPPFFGGLQVYFPNPPEVDIGFGGAAKVADIPGLKGAIRGAIDGAVGGICVLPRRIAIDMDPEDDMDAVDLSYPEPAGILRFTLWSASKLIASDAGLGWFSAPSSDPFVVAALGIVSWTSPTIKKNLNPVWGEGGKGIITDFPVHDEAQTVSLRVYDYDFGTSDDLIGYASPVNARELAQNGEKQSVELLKADGEAGGGSVSISANILSLLPAGSAKPESLGDEASEAFLSAKMLTIKGIALGAAYPFTVKLQVVKPGAKKGAADIVLVEDCTKPSHPKEAKQLAEAYQEIAKHLAEKGTKTAEIAEILEVTDNEVKDFLAVTSFKDDADKKANAAKRHQGELERLSTAKPRFDEALQHLLPSGSVDKVTSMVLTISDKNKKTVGTARVAMKDLLGTPKSQLDGPFSTDVPGLDVIGSIRLRWLGKRA